MTYRSENEWEWAVGLFVGGLILWKARSFGSSLSSALTPSLPDGVHLPETGPLHQVAAVKTPLDPSGLLDLYNRAAQIVERPLAASWLEDVLRAHDIVSLSWDVPAVDEEYRVPAAMFASQACVETDSGRSVFNFNLGNLTVVKGDFYRNPKVTAPLNFGSFNFPLQGAVAHVARVKRLWPEAYKAAFSGTIDAYARGLQDGKLVYAGGVTAASLAAAIRARAVQLGVAGQGLASIIAGGVRNLRLGMRGPDVAEWQRFLNAATEGSGGLVVDGVFGRMTMRATRAFQTAHGLDADGIVGPKTRTLAGGSP